MSIQMSSYPEFNVGNMVIAVSNEWENMIVGKVKDFFVHGSGEPLPIIHDLVSKQDFVSMGIIVHYSPEVLKALCKLTPYERYTVLSRGRIKLVEDKEKRSNDELLTYKQYIDAIHQTRLI